MRLLFGRPVPTQGRQPEIATAPAVHLPTLLLVTCAIVAAPAAAQTEQDRWFGVNADYRHFIVNADATEHVNRFTTGISLSVK